MVYGLPLLWLTIAAGILFGLSPPKQSRSPNRSAAEPHDGRGIMDRFAWVVNWVLVVMLFCGLVLLSRNLERHSDSQRAFFAESSQDRLRLRNQVTDLDQRLDQRLSELAKLRELVEAQAAAEAAHLAQPNWWVFGQPQQPPGVKNAETPRYRQSRDPQVQKQSVSSRSGTNQ